MVAWAAAVEMVVVAVAVVVFGVAVAVMVGAVMIVYHWSGWFVGGSHDLTSVWVG